MTFSASVTKICNRGLQHLGAARILDISDDTVSGRACSATYDSVRRSEIRKHRWTFAIKRATAAPLVEADPLGQFLYIFALPPTCLRILKPRDATLDWQLEGRKIFTNQSDTLHLRYMHDEEDPNFFDPMFSEALSLKIAEAICEEITGSTSKKKTIAAEYKTLISDAKRVNAMETIPVEPEEDPWLLGRL